MRWISQRRRPPPWCARDRDLTFSPTLLKLAQKTIECVTGGPSFHKWWAPHHRPRHLYLDAEERYSSAAQHVPRVQLEKLFTYLPRKTPHTWLLKLLAETQFVEARVLLYGGIPGEPACSDAGTCFICDETMGTGRERPRYGRHASGRICGQEVPQLSCQQRARWFINPADTCPSW